MHVVQTAQLVALTVAASNITRIQYVTFGCCGGFPRGFRPFPRAVDGKELWLEGLKEVASLPDRVHGFWVNETDVLVYDGDSEAFNQSMDGCSKLKGIALNVVLLHRHEEGAFTMGCGRPGHPGRMVPPRGHPGCWATIKRSLTGRL
ncbi:MAG: hypothetical protein C0483_11320 [Pirellula sp.]|nr:hypothetical protein [Pirellula sp.]